MSFFKDWGTKKSSDKLSTNIAWAFQLVWQSGHALTVANVALTVMQSVLPLIGLYLMKLVIDAVSAGLTHPDKMAAFKGVTFLIVLLSCVLLFERILGTLADLVDAAQAHIVTDHMCEILHSKSVEMDLEYYENSDFYDKLHRAQQEAAYIPTRIVSGLFKLGQSAISMVAIGVLLITFHWSVPVFLVLVTVPGLLVRFRFAKGLYLWSRKQTANERKALYFASMLMGVNHAKEIRLFSLGNIFVESFERLRSKIRQEKLNLLIKRSTADLITQFGAIIPAFGLYGFLAFRTIHGLMTIGGLVMFYQAVQRGQSYLNQFLGSIASLYENNLFLSNVHEFLALKPKVTDPARPRPIAQTLCEGIIFHDVRFRYPNSDRTVLDGINLHIRPGEHIALLGENGSGKTTLVKLLSRLYDPTEGAITFDGIDLRELSLGALRRKISVIFQDYVKYHLTVKENIWFGNIERPPDEKRIASAARQAGAHEAIAKLRNGYETVLGKQFENGEELSVGEWQKVALARAFLRDAEIVILDEPTSAMDAKAEYEVFKKFHQLSKQRTAILISHRLSTVKMADRIYFLEGGAIAEAGTHDELIQRRGKYADMFEKQAANYR